MGYADDDDVSYSISVAWRKKVDEAEEEYPRREKRLDQTSLVQFRKRKIVAPYSMALASAKRKYSLDSINK